MPMSMGEPRGPGGRNLKGRAPAAPMWRMLSSPAVWAIVVNNFTFHYAFYVVMNWLPTYFDRVRLPFTSDGCHRYLDHLIASHRWFPTLWQFDWEMLLSQWVAPFDSHRGSLCLLPHRVHRTKGFEGSMACAKHSISVFICLSVAGDMIWRSHWVSAGAARKSGRAGAGQDSTLPGHVCDVKHGLLAG